MKISVSFLSSNDKAKDLKKLNITDADYIHVDYMDGKFVPNKSLQFKDLKKIYKYTSKRLDVHLMCIKPAKLIKKFAMLNTEYITVHVELDEDIKKLLDLIHLYGIKSGLAINPNTDINLLKDYINDLDMIIVMGVEPGSGGQEYIKETTNKVLEIKNLLKENNREDVVISVDGGINDLVKNELNNIDILVSGSYILNSSNYQEKIDSLR